MVRIYVVYNYGQYNHLIHRTLRDLDVETKLIQNTTPAEELKDLDGLVIGGGPSIERAGNSFQYLELDIPILGICLGLHIIAEHFGGKVGKGNIGGYAEVEVNILQDDELFNEIPSRIKVWASHADEVKEIPEGFIHLAKSDICNYEAIRHPDKPIYGIQWHPEVYHSSYGEEIYRNFIEICRK
ncbi:GMP synthase (glutamine-hydrolyzing), N-terminal domain or A subunit [Archaeoglobus sulfaticallidus PM70-1]|uniref:GMP synthase [glutamine-hydrolyzing] subunit A n=1 Tax=Archaeoglobus sulfaticallidus PM70-1 TaxID=387631 RepID=N0BKX7_9EURY|nr:GMP synthase subunit A [Archaeoglobus sulfaticallidus]AGK60865.1 GMP synthase (glutamine-hydrolyzing), N-terminal domain or A subunit [Archaeoglobus sulfaticallidus PM70-1]